MQVSKKDQSPKYAHYDSNFCLKYLLYKYVSYLF